MNTLPASSGPVLVYALPPVWGEPSPFAIKLLTWLRMAVIPHELRVLTGPPRSKTGKIPYVQLPSGELLSDSQLIIEELTRRHSVDLDAGLTPEQRAMGLATRRMIEEHMYFIGVWERWITDAGFARTAPDYFAHLPAPARWMLSTYIRRNMRSYLHGQGLGRHSPEIIAAMAVENVAALSTLLGDKEFLLGPPSSVDATMYGFVAAFTSHPFPSVIKDAAATHTNLAAYRKRVRARWWPELA